MPFAVIRNDITKMRVDAIVNAANPTLLGGGGVDGAIHRAAGPGLRLACLKLGGCRVGEAKLTGGHRLPCKYVIHTVGPRWHGGNEGEADQLAACYRNSLELARANGCESVAFPLISSGAYGYPKAEALRVATRTIAAFLEEAELQVYLVIFDRASMLAGSELFAGIRRYIDDVYADARDDSNYRALRNEAVRPAFPAPRAGARPFAEAEPCEEAPAAAAPAPRESLDAPRPTAPGAQRAQSLDELLASLDESFAQMLFRKIDERGMTDVECYKRANLDRKLFSKIRSNPAYKPSKPTAVALAVALELPLEETRELLAKAGFALSHSSKFDVIVEYCIRRRVFDIYEINNVLFEYDMPLLGAV